MTEGAQKKRILVDTDPNLWVSRRDIDDALALLFLMASPEVQIEGITVNFGNVGTPVGCAAAREVLERAGRSLPLYRGAESRRDLGKKNDAVEFLLQTVRQSPGEAGQGPVRQVRSAPQDGGGLRIVLDPAAPQPVKSFMV